MKAEIYLKTYEFKTNYHSKEWNYGIPKNALLSIENIISLILYTDFTKLSYKFSQTYIAQNEIETLNDIKKRHRNYHWFAKSLNIVIQLFGKSINKNVYYYHCINIPVSFNSTICRFNHVYSMTNSIEVGTNFSVNNGILLKLASYNKFNNDYNYFNLNLISSFTNEYEKLFIGYDNDNIQLQIYDIIMCSNGNKYSQYLKALNVLINAMNGEYPNGYIRSRSKSSIHGRHHSVVSKKDKKIVKSIINDKSYKFDQIEYFKSILNNYKFNKKIVIIDLYLMKKKHIYSFMSSYFLSSSTSSSLKYVIKFHIISNLFKNVNKIILTNGSGYNHNSIIISSHYLTYILSSLLSLIKASFKKLKQIKMRNVKLESFDSDLNDEQNINDLVDSFQIRYRQQIGFDIYLEKILFHNQDYYTLFIVKCKKRNNGLSVDLDKDDGMEIID